MIEKTLTHPDWPTTFTVSTFEKGESKGWNGDKYVTHGPSIVILEVSNAEWNWTEYDNPSDKAEERLTRLTNNGWVEQ